MTPFEYVSVLISIILAMGITQILTGVTDMIQKGEHSRLCIRHLLWVCFIFFLHLQEWWVTFELREKTAWSLRASIIVLFYPIALFILARLLFPRDSEKESMTDYVRFYLDNHRKLFQWSIVLAVLTIFDNLLNLYPPDHYILPVCLILIFSTFLIFKIKNPWAHNILVFSLLFFLLYVLFFHDIVIGFDD